jgi:hypothetical protein
MSVADVDAALDLIRATSETPRFHGPKSSGLISKAETALGFCFPPSYRRFLAVCGCGGIAGEEFYGIVGSNVEEPGVPNGIWLTLDFRRSFGLPTSLLLVASTGFGPYYALDVSKIDASGEAPVVEWSPGEKDFAHIAPDFGTFFLKTIGRAIARARNITEA